MILDTNSERKELKEELLEVITHHRNKFYTGVEKGYEWIADFEGLDANHEAYKFELKKAQDEYDSAIIVEALKELVKEIK